jgi:hypothetical protein
VTDQHDPVDEWLERDVRPLLPPSGTLDRIRHRARRRKRNQALLAAAGCAVVVAGVATAPQIASALHNPPAGRPVASALPPTAKELPSAGPASGTSAPEATHAIRIPAPHIGLSPGPVASDPVPSHFRPTSVTFAGTGSGGVVGAVIGQAGPPCATRFCTSLAQTPDYGGKWFGLAAPETGAPNGSTGVSQIRFADLKHGWAFGPALWQTSTGGWPWHPENTYGLRVIDLEATRQRAFAVFAACTGSGTDYAGGCTSFRLYTSATGSSTWTPVTVPAAFQVMKSTGSSSVSLVIAGGTTGYLLTPSGQVLSGPVAGGSWTLDSQAPCPQGSAQLAAGQSLLLACTSGQQTTIYGSASGAAWQRVGTVTTPGAANSVSSDSTGHVVLATTEGLYYSVNGGGKWQAAAVAAAPAGGFRYVGMTNSAQGVALPADATLGEIFVTSDGGRTWTASPVKG